MTGRGLSDDALALRRFADALLAVRDLEAQVLRRVDDLIAAQDGLAEAGVDMVELRFGRELEAFIQVRRGVAFWNRPVPDATPAALTGSR